MINLSPPIESPLRALGETPLRALQTPPMPSSLAGWSYYSVGGLERFVDSDSGTVSGFPRLLPPYNDDYAFNEADFYINNGSPPTVSSAGRVVTLGSGWSVIPSNELIASDDPTVNILVGKFGSDLSATILLPLLFPGGTYSLSGGVFVFNYFRIDSDGNTVPEPSGLQHSLSVRLQLVKYDGSMTVDITPPGGIHGDDATSTDFTLDTTTVFGDLSAFYPQLTISSPNDPGFTAADFEGVFAYSPVFNGTLI